MSIRKIFGISVFVLIVCFLVYTWSIIHLESRYISSKHIFASVLVVLNGLVYFMNFKWGLRVTAFVLLGAFFNLLAFFPDISSRAFYLKVGNTEISTPSFQWKFLLLFIVHLVANWEGIIESPQR